MRFLKGVLIMAWLVAWGVSSLGSPEAPPRYWKLTILHTNDTHGNLLPFNYPDPPDPNTQEAQLALRRDIGGIARRATVARQSRNAFGTTWVVDVGDFCDGTAFSVEFRGEADVAAMNALGYTIGTHGNHEFNNTRAQWQKLVQMARYPVVCANVVDASTKQPLLKPYEILQVEGARIAVLGLVTESTRGYPATREGIEIQNAIDTARRLVPELRRQADVVLLLSHLGYEVDRRLAREVPGIDIIVGGHSHTRLAKPDFVPAGDLTSVFQKNGTVIAQAFQWGGELGRLEIILRRDPNTGKWTFMSYRGDLILISPDIPDDPTVKAVVDRYWKPMKAYYGVVIGEAEDDFTHRGDDDAEYNLVADAVREVLGTEADLENMGGVRAPVLRGPITRYDLAKALPFGNTMVKFRATGAQLRELLRRTRPAVSGIRYRYRRGELVEVTINGQPLQDDRQYLLSTNSYFAQRYLQPMGIAYEDTGRKRLDIVSEYILKHQRIRPAYDGRRIVDESVY
ncbi:MAG: multifunctional 2',3'-cyclic-nucleotide 2'-phosphodiesterase/5'-nucleotidase/3'-nucleotidase [Armatimonadota bacterium]|nr:MAG: multifunctional 2',3'-cyclic-nucleotide 2'-phosphodiesterase/5'-nucleotidase/3'-nucleotidase [Armatimonadota bacterium]